MGRGWRGWKIGAAIVVVLALLLAVNAYSVDHETAGAEITVPGARIIAVGGGKLQVLERGPRSGSPIVLIHCFACSIDWWDRMMPILDRSHRVIAADLLGHGGSEKPASGYAIPNQAAVLAEALAKLGVRGAEVVGHSLGGAVAMALAERSPALVSRLVIIDTPPEHQEGNLGFTANLLFSPVIGEALWRIKPDFAVRQGLEVAFAPGFKVPDAFVEDVDRMTYSAYNESSAAFSDYTGEESLARRARAVGKPLLVIMGAEDQIIHDPQAALSAYSHTVPNAFTDLIPGVGHSPNVEAPKTTATIVLGFLTPFHR